jgi:CrcB protein
LPEPPRKQRTMHAPHLHAPHLHGPHLHGSRGQHMLPPDIDQQIIDHPIDPDVDLHSPPQRNELIGHHVSILAVIALGGMVGAAVRYLIESHHPAAPGSVPWATLFINVSGCLLIGALMPALETQFPGHRLARPFLATGVLGGYTTFSTYCVESNQLLRGGHVLVACSYLAVTVVAAVVAASIGQLGSSVLVERARRARVRMGAAAAKHTRSTAR